MIDLLSSSDIDWNYFLKLAVERHRLTGSVYKNLKIHATGLVPDSVCEYLKQQCQKNAYQMMHKAAELVRLTTLFTEAGIRVLPYKGPVLAIQLFGDLSMRRSGDLDALPSRRHQELKQNCNLLKHPVPKVHPDVLMAQHQQQSRLVQSSPCNPHSTSS